MNVSLSRRLVVGSFFLFVFSMLFVLFFHLDLQTHFSFPFPSFFLRTCEPILFIQVIKKSFGGGATCLALSLEHSAISKAAVSKSLPVRWAARFPPRSFLLIAGYIPKHLGLCTMKP